MYKNEFKTGISVSRKFPQRKFVQMLERSQSVHQCHNSIANVQDWYFTGHGSHVPQQDDGTFVESSRRRICKSRQWSELVVNIETGAKLSVTIGKVEELNTCHDEWTMTGEEKEEEQEQQAMRNE